MRRIVRCAVLVLALAPPTTVHAGAANPDISAIGQPTLRWHDAAGDPARKRPVFDVGETEIVFDSALNPYARGLFALSLASGQVELEEGYFSLLRGLPGSIALKGGKYRVGFGRLNAQHPHQYPFATRFDVLSACLPGDEAFSDTGVDLSWRLPLPGAWSVTASADVLQGDSFRIERAPGPAANDPLLADPQDGDRTSEPRSAWVGRLAAFIPARDRSGVELGFTVTEGTNNVAAAARTRVIGADLKAKLWTSANAYLLVQGELLQLDRDTAGWAAPSATYTRGSTEARGGYVFADYNWARRYNAGASFEGLEDPDAAGARRSAFGLFAGLALMEETTVFRLDWRHVQPGRPAGAIANPDPENHLTLRVIFSMGPHKAHTF